MIETGTMRIMAYLVLAAALAGNGGCGSGPGGRTSSGGGSQGNGSTPEGPAGEEVFRYRREKMVESQIRARGIEDPRVLQAMLEVPRHLFVPASQRAQAYEDGPLSIGEDQTISQPYIVALMSELALPKPTDRVLEIGTGSGYQAAVLSRLVAEVYTIEIVESLGLRAAELLRDLGCANVRTRIGDGYRGWPEAAPFDAILVTAAPDRIPPPLLEQLGPGGRLVIPVGTGSQDLVRVTRKGKDLREEVITPVRFVPMTGEAETR